MKVSRQLWARLALVVFFTASSFAQQSAQPAPSQPSIPSSGFAGLDQYRASRIAIFTDDFGELARYPAADAALKAPARGENRVVFFGDSITDFWKLADYFPGKPYVNRGIGGQTTPQMLVRIYPDVIDLKPAVMIVLAGTNDIARNTGPMTAELIEENIMAITELAQHHGIKVVLSSVLPVSDYPFLQQQSAAAAPAAPAGPGRGPYPRVKMPGGRPPSDILKLNAW